MGISSDKERLSIIGLHLVPEIGPHRFKNLVARFGSAFSAINADVSDIALVEDIPHKTAHSINASMLLEDAEKEIGKTKKAGADIITCIDEGYPEAFKNIAGGPIVIYVRGSIVAGDSLSVAVIGTRRPTSYGRAAAERFSRELAISGVTTVSGLARGIDSEVHSASISAGGRTIAVLGNGLNWHYPPENRKLEDNIASHGALITEFAMDVSPDKCNFPRRNRLISAFALATLIIEADEKSGALITAKYCAEQGKDVFAVPGPVFSKYSKGPHMLIKQGAHLAETAYDILEEIRPMAEAFGTAKVEPEKRPLETTDFEGVESRIMALLENNFNGISADKLSAVLGLAPAEIFSSLTTLEIKGYIKCLPGKSYVRNRSES
jgi:DNA processing protein